MEEIGTREFGWSNKKRRETLGINQTGRVIPGRKDKNSSCLSDSGLTQFALTILPSCKALLQGAVPTENLSSARAAAAFQGLVFVSLAPWPLGSCSWAA